MPWEEDRYEFYADLFDEVEAAEKAEPARRVQVGRLRGVRYASAGGASEKKKGKRRKGSGRRKGAAKAKAAKARGGRGGRRGGA